MMEKKIGHRFIVETATRSKRWFPTMGQPESETPETWRTDTFDIICMSRKLAEVEDRVRECMTEDYGLPGVNDSVGVKWSFEIKSLTYKGEVRLPAE